MSEYFKQELASCGGKRHITKFIDDQQLAGLDLVLKLKKPPLVTGLQQLMDQTGRRGEANREAALASGEAKSQTDVGLAGARVAKGNDVFPTHDVFTPAEFEYQHLIE
jgi:hypothetical protein